MSEAATPGAISRSSRLRDRALESELREGAIVPLAIHPPAAPPAFDRGEATAARRRSKGRMSGLLLHRFLEVWDGKSDAETLLRRLGLEAAATAETMATVRRRIESLRQSPALHRIVDAETIGRELPVTIREDGDVMQRRIDRLIRENGQYIVVDYKSGRADEARLARDRVQVGQYCAAIAGMTGSPCTALLWYIDLESDSLVAV
jgi:ATP-dependent exoDNAse (exonuclease V) beta subunit